MGVFSDKHSVLAASLFIYSSSQPHLPHFIYWFCVLSVSHSYCKLQRQRYLLFCSLLWTWFLKQFLAHVRHSINTFWTITNSFCPLWPVKWQVWVIWNLSLWVFVVGWNQFCFSSEFHSCLKGGVPRQFCLIPHLVHWMLPGRNSNQLVQ